MNEWWCYPLTFMTDEYFSWLLHVYIVKNGVLLLPRRPSIEVMMKLSFFGYGICSYTIYIAEEKLTIHLNYHVPVKNDLYNFGCVAVTETDRPEENIKKLCDVFFLWTRIFLYFHRTQNSHSILICLAKGFDNLL